MPGHGNQEAGHGGESDVWDQGRGGAVMDWPTNSADLVTRRSEEISGSF